MLEYLRAGFRSDAFDLVQLRSDAVLGAHLAVEGDREAVDLFLDPLHKMEGLAVRIQFHDFILLTEDERGRFVLRVLDHAGHRDVQSEFVLQHFLGGMHLNLAAVHQDQVRHGAAFAQQPAIAAADDFLGRREFIAAFDRLDFVFPVVLAFRLAVPVDDHRRDRVGSLDVRMVERLDDFQIFDAQRFGKLLDGADRLVGVALDQHEFLGQRQFAVRDRQFEDTALAAADRGVHLRSERFLQQLRVDPFRQEHFLRQDVIGILIELHNEGSQLFLRRIVAREKGGFALDDRGLAQQEDLDRQPAFVHMEGEDVAVRVVTGHDRLFFDGRLDVADLVAVIGSLFEIQAVGGAVHFFPQILFDLLDVAVQESGNPFDLGIVFLFRYLVVAAADALAHMVIEAGALGIFGALAQRIDLLDEFLRLRRRVDVRIGSEIDAAVILDRRSDDELRILFVRDLQIRIHRPLLQLDVVFGLVTLDQVDLQQQGFLVRFGDDRFEPLDVRDQQLRLAFVLAMEVGFHAVLQIFGLADVDDFVILVPHDVAAGQVGQQRQFLVDFFSAHPFQSFYF